MISQQTIDKVQELDLVEVISKFGIDLKKSGANWMALSPFTEEKSPSFSVSAKKGMFKCFSTGKGGSTPVSFAMLYKSCSYTEAIQHIADLFNIQVEYDNSEQSKKYLEKQQRLRSFAEINSVALEFFQENLERCPEDKLRFPIGFLREKGVGFAPDDFNELISFLLQNGFSKEQLAEAGLAKVSEKGSYYAAFRNRIMFPIITASGIVVGFSGRNITDEKPKYLNTAETDAFSKSDSILGISYAKESIREKGWFIKVEGNFDVIALWSLGIDNVVAPMGTAFTQNQAEILAKLAHEMIIFADTDSAGIKSLRSNIVTALKAGLMVRVYIHESEDEKADPDSIVRSKEWIMDEKHNDLLELINLEAVDGVEYLANQLFDEAQTIAQKSRAESELAHIIANIPDQKLRNSYVEAFSKTYKIQKKAVESEVSARIQEFNAKVEDENKGYKFPKYLSKQAIADFHEYQFYEDRGNGDYKATIGYYFPYGEGKNFERITNFIIHPIFQLGESFDGGRICEIESPKEKIVRILPKEMFNNPSAFENLLGGYGDFQFDGVKKHLNKIRRKLYPKFIRHEEINTLGWHRDGFFATADGIMYQGEFFRINRFGSVELKDKFYFLPAFSDIYKHLPEEMDDFESDRKFVYRPGAISLNEWYDQFVSIYGEHGKIGIAYLFCALFRSYIQSQTNGFPQLFTFGRPTTGKTTMGRSLSAIFFNDTVPFNLTTGNTKALQRKMAAYRDTIIHLDEYKNDLKEDNREALKGLFDGTGYEAAKRDHSNRTRTIRINSAAYISGQDMPSYGDGAMFSRSIFLQFTKTANEWTEEEKLRFNNYKEIESKGLSHLIAEILRYRDIVAEKFNEYRFSIEKELNRELEGFNFNGRVVESYSTLLSVFKIMNESKGFSTTFEEMKAICKRLIIFQSTQINETNALHKFWQQVEYLSETYQITHGRDFVVKIVTELDVRQGRDEKIKVQLGAPTRVLFVKLAKVHTMYKENYRKQTGENGLDIESIKNYARVEKSWIGPVAVVEYDSKVKSSGYAFRYDMLNIQLFGVPLDGEPEKKHPHETAGVKKGQPIELPEADNEEGLPF